MILPDKFEHSLSIVQRKKIIKYAWVKRTIDVVGASIGILIAFPFLIIIAVIIWMDSPGPVIYRQKRIGKGGREFEILKFRSMGADAKIEDRKEKHLNKNPKIRLSWEEFQKLVNDPRLTRVGRHLRILSIDELPQLWNVLKGDMSLVGPRPCLPYQTEFYGRAFEWYTFVRPGLTGLWQVSGRNRLSYFERVRLDVAYIEQWSLVFDMQILIRTIRAVIKREGAF